MTGDQIVDFVEAEPATSASKEIITDANIKNAKPSKADDGHTCLYLNDLNWVNPIFFSSTLIVLVVVDN